MQPCHLFCHFPGVVLGRIFAFVTALLLLIHNDKPDVGERGKKRRTGTYHHIDFPAFCPLALVVFFALGQSGIEYGHPVAEAGVKPEKCLVGEGNFRYQHNRLFSPCHHTLNQIHIHFRFTASGNPVQQICLSDARIKFGKHGVHNLFLSGA